MKWNFERLVWKTFIFVWDRLFNFSQKQILWNFKYQTPFLLQDLSLNLNFCSDGMARIFIFSIQCLGSARSRKFIMSGSIQAPQTREKKTIWMKLGLNPRPLALQVTALSITPWLPGCIAQKHTCFSPSSPRFDSWNSPPKISKEKLSMLLRFINSAG